MLSENANKGHFIIMRQKKVNGEDYRILWGF